MKRVALAMLAFALATCKDSSGPANSVTQFISGITAAGTSTQALLVRGQRPAPAGGPAVTPTGPSTVINGGSSQVDLSAGAAFSVVIVYVDGRPDYYQLTLPTAVTSVQLIITLSTNIPGTSFDCVYGVGAAVASLGAYAVTPVSVVQVGSGDIQVSVSWDVNSDVDLHLVEPGPSSEEIFYGNPIAGSGGELDLDSNAACSIDGVRNENITYPSSAPPRGAYTVRVDYWDSCGLAQTNYLVTVRVKGQAVRTFQGAFTGAGDNGGAGSGVQITQFTY